MNNDPNQNNDLIDESEEELSDYGGSIYTSEFTSLKSGLLNFIYENGRRYQGLLANQYGLPNDEPEQARENLKHKVYCDYILEGKLFCSPIGNNPQKIVDLGCGTGCWPLDVGERYPSAIVIGSDISPIQSPWPPSNVQFHLENLDDEFEPWARIYDGADFIFMRSVLQTIRNSSLFLQRAWDALKPGGWIECHEIVLPVTWEDGTPATEHPFSKLYERMATGSYKDVYGWDVFLPRRLPQVLADAGFINVQEKHTHIPLGRWPRDRRLREMGMLNETIMWDWVGAVMANHKGLGMGDSDADQFVREIMMAVQNTKFHARVDWATFWAQKPC